MPNLNRSPFLPIIAADFAKATGKSAVATYANGGETIRVKSNGANYVMHVGSDDDGFTFVNTRKPTDVVQFKFSRAYRSMLKLINGAIADAQ